MSNPKMFKYELIWDKLKGRQPFLAKICPMKSHENILVFCKNKTIYNPQMTKAEPKNMRDRAKNIKKETDRGSSYSLEEFEKKYKNENKKTSFFKYVDELVANYISTGRVGNAKIYRDTKREVYKFRNGLDLSFTDIDLSFLKKLENFFRAKGYKENTMSVFFRTLRSIYNKAKKRIKRSLALARI